MKIIQTLAMLCVLAISFNLKAQNYFLKTYGDTLFHQYGENLVPMSDGGFLITGMLEFKGQLVEELSRGLYMVRTDSLGDTLWTHQYDSAAYQTIEPVRTFIDASGNIIVFARARDIFTCGGFGTTFPYVRIKTLTFNSNGNFVRSHIYTTECTQFLFDLVPSILDRYQALIVDMDNSSNRTFAAVELNTTGVQTWNSTYTHPQNYNHASIAALTDTNYIFIGSSNASGSYDLVIARSQRFNGIQFDTILVDTFHQSHPIKILPLSDGSFYLLSGESQTLSPSDYTHTVIYKADSDLNVLWKKYYPHRAIDIELLPDNRSLLLANTIDTAAFPNEDPVVMMLDTLGDIEWIRQYSFTENNQPKDIEVIPNGYAVTGNFACCSQTGAFGPGQAYLLVDSLNNTDTSTTLSISSKAIAKNRVSIYPNPVKDELKVVIENSAVNAVITIMDITGSIQKQQTINLRTTTLNLTDLTNGVYFISIQNGAEETVKKLVKY